MFFLSTAKRCSYMTSIQRFPSQSHPLIGSSVQNHSMVIWNRPRQINLDQGRPWQTMAGQGRPRQTIHHAGGCRGCKWMQWGCRGMQPSQQQPLWQTKADHGRPSHCDMCGATSISDAFLKYVIQVCRNQSHGRKLQMFLIGAFRFGVGMKKKNCSRCWRSSEKRGGLWGNSL